MLRYDELVENNWYVISMSGSTSKEIQQGLELPLPCGLDVSRPGRMKRTEFPPNFLATSRLTELPYNGKRSGLGTRYTLCCMASIRRGVLGEFEVYSLQAPWLESGP